MEDLGVLTIGINSIRERLICVLFDLIHKVYLTITPFLALYSKNTTYVAGKNPGSRDPGLGLSSEQCCAERSPGNSHRIPNPGSREPGTFRVETALLK